MWHLDSKISSGMNGRSFYFSISAHPAITEGISEGIWLLANIAASEYLLELTSIETHRSGKAKR